MVSAKRRSKSFLFSTFCTKTASLKVLLNSYNCFIDGSGGVCIGNDVSISAFSKVYSCSHKTDSPFFEYFTNPVEIKDNVWIAANAMILEGTVLNEFSVIGANSCFKGVTEKGYIYYGNPAKKMKKRNLDKKYAIDYHPHFR